MNINFFYTQYSTIIIKQNFLQFVTMWSLFYDFTAVDNDEAEPTATSVMHKFHCIRYNAVCTILHNANLY